MMSLNDRKILVLPFALESEELRHRAEFLSRQFPVLLRNCFEARFPGRVVTSPIATEKDGERVWIVHSQLWADEAAAEFARERGYEVVVFGSFTGSATSGVQRTMKMRAILTESRKVLIDKLVTGDMFRLTERALEGLGVYIPMTPRQAAALFEPQTRSVEAFEQYLAGLDVLLALRSPGLRLPDPAAAFAPFETALAISPDFADALTAQLSCALQAAEPSGAVLTTAAVAKALEHLIAGHPRDPRPYAVMAEVHIHRGDMPAALAVLNRGLAGSQATNRDLLRRSADVLVELGRKDEALTAYEAVLALEPEDALVERIASLEIMLARNDRALERLEVLLARNPDRIDLQARCALLLHRMDRKAACWARFGEIFRDHAGPAETELAKLNAILARERPGEDFVARVRTWYPPEDFVGVRRLLFARSLRLLGARFEAGLCLRTVVEHDLDEEHRALLVRERLNLLHDGFDQNFALLAQRIVNEGLTEGVELIEAAIEEEPLFWPARFLRGLVFSRRGDYEASLADLDVVLELQPENDVAWYTRGLQYARLGRDVEAIRCFESAILLNGKETDYHSNLALSHARLRNEEAARAALEQVKTLRPDDPDNDRLLQAIEQSL